MNPNSFNPNDRGLPREPGVLPHVRTISEIARVEVGALGPRLPDEVSPLLRVVEEFEDIGRNVQAVFEDPPEVPSSNIAVRNAKAEELANTASLFPANWLKILVAIYEFNYLTGEQIEVLTGIGKTGVSKRMNLWLSKGVVRGIKIGRRRIWFLTDLGARCGRQIISRSGPLIPLEPGKGEDGRYEASRKWAARNNPNPRAIIHDLHVASYVFQFALLCDGDMGVFDCPEDGIIQNIRGEFSSVVRPPLVPGRRGNLTPLDSLSMYQVNRELSFRGMNSDDGRFGSLSPDAIIEMHNLSPERLDPRDGQREVWIELDRQGNYSKLGEKLTRFDHFLGAWWMATPRYREAGRPPFVVFVAPDISILQKMLRIADETLKVCSFQRRLGPSAGKPPASRRLIFFALESDLHQGSMRAYRVPEKPPRERVREASDQSERTEAMIIHPQIVHLLPDHLLAGK